jgi:hypothetical protein
MNRPAKAAAAAVILAAALTLFGTPAAQAFADPATLSVTATDLFPEAGKVHVVLECPSGSTYGVVLISTTEPSFPPFQFDDALDASGVLDFYQDMAGFSAGAPYDAPPGMNVAFAGFCYSDDTALKTLIGTTPTVNYAVPNWGMAVSTPASTALADPILVSANCGTPVSGFVPSFFQIVIYQGSTPLFNGYTPAGSVPLVNYALGSPASYGLTSGQSYRLLVMCLGSYNSSPPDIGASRYVNGAAGPRVSPPGDPGNPGGGELANTGTAPAGVLPLAAVFLLGGILLIELERRSRRAEGLPRR